MTADQELGRHAMAGTNVPGGAACETPRAIAESGKDVGDPSRQSARGAAPRRIVVLGGGFAGVYTARSLERCTGRRRDVEIVLVSRDNFFLMTPLLFEACSGVLELRHCSAPIREFFRRTRFVEATVREVDLERRVVHAAAAEGAGYEIAYDHLVLALGAVTNERLIPGSEFAFTFKTLADAIVVRNHVIERFERADAEADAAVRRRLLTFVVIGGGLVGVEVFGELTAFAEDIRRNYPRVSRDELRFVLRQAEPRLLPETDDRLADYALRVLRRRPEVDIRSAAPVRRIERGMVHLADESIAADTIILAAGILPNPVVAGLPVEKDDHGRIAVDGTMRSRSHPGVWGLGDCASVPGPDGKPYPCLAQHAMRQAKRLARNLCATIDGGAPRPFVYETIGIMGALGHYAGFGRVCGLRLRGFPAWWARRTYYLLVMPRWSRRLRIVADWTTALLLRPDTVKVDLDPERELARRGTAAGAKAGS